MRPLADAVELEIVGVGDRPALRLLRLLDPVGDALAGRVGDRLLLRVEPQLHLLARVAGRRPAHQGLDLARLDAVELEQPLLRPGLAGLHRGLGGLVDAGGGHRSACLFSARRWSGRPDSNQRPSAPKADALPDCATPRTSRPRPRWLARGTGGGQGTGFSARATVGRCSLPVSPGACAAHRLANSGCSTRSPALIPSRAAVPPASSSTARTGSPDGMVRVDSGSAFSATRATDPSGRMNSMSRGM